MYIVVVSSSLSGIRPPADPEGTPPPFVLISDIHFWLTDPKIFLKATSASNYTEFEEERAPKKNHFQRVPILACLFFKHLHAA